jgi:hypothetical protein
VKSCPARNRRKEGIVQTQTTEPIAETGQRTFVGIVPDLPPNVAALVSGINGED